MGDRVLCPDPHLIHKMKAGHRVLILLTLLVQGACDDIFVFQLWVADPGLRFKERVLPPLKGTGNDPMRDTKRRGLSGHQYLCVRACMGKACKGAT